MRGLFFVHQPQDLDLLIPIAKGWRERYRDANSLRLWVYQKMLKKNPGILSRIKKQFGKHCEVSEWRLFLKQLPENIATFDILLTASESSARPHWPARRVTDLANEAGIKTCTLQHGLENIGLTYSDKEYPIEKVHFISQKILIWGNQKNLHPSVCAQTRKKCVSIGYIQKNDPSNSKPPEWAQAKWVIGVFENLHWSRYSDGFRKKWLKLVKDVAQSHPEVVFVLKAHPDQKWGEHHRASLPVGLKNVVYLRSGDSEAGARPAADYFQWMSGVWTTPSTVALDAAGFGLPVAVFVDEKAGQTFEPLIKIDDHKSLSEFVRNVEHAESNQVLKQKSREFFEKKCVSDQGALQALCEIVGNQFALSKQDSKSWVSRCECAVMAWKKSTGFLSDRLLSVGDFGCGDQKLLPILASFRPKLFEYKGYDFLPQSQEVTFFDFEASLPKGPFDVVFCLGLLEYLSRPDDFLKNLSFVAKEAVVSYVVFDQGKYSAPSIQKAGWKHAFRSDEMEKLIQSNGWKIVRRTLCEDFSNQIWVLKGA